MAPLTDGPTVAELLDIWQEALTTVADLAESLTPEEWTLQTPCPGWTVSDVVAHVIDIEQLFGGEDRPDHEPDWATLTHVSGDFSRMTEVGVDVRRGRTPEALVGELRDTIARRRAQLDALPEGAEVLGVSGRPTTLDRFLRTRTFDTWVHEQDIRWATNHDGGWNTAPAGISFSQMMRALPVVWSANVEAPVGAVLQLTVIGPDMHHVSLVTVGEDGRGVAAPEGTRPNLEADMTWAAYMRLSAGRVAVDDPWLSDKLEMMGDAELGKRLLPGLAITP